MGLESGAQIWYSEIWLLRMILRKPESGEQMKERLQKLIAQRGIASRRRAEALIAAGNVQVNGVTASIGDKADPENDYITVNGQELDTRHERVYIMLNKPRGYLTTMRDERGRKTVAQLVTDVDAPLHPVGRLDMGSEGLLLLTSDGDVTNRVTHPSGGVPKTYRVSVRGEDIRRSAREMGKIESLDGEAVRPAHVELVRLEEDRGVLSVIIGEGKNRQVRRLCEATGLEVRRLQRVAEGKLLLGGLHPGKWRYLSAEEIAYLKSI